jgi:shikimate kinase
MMIKRSIPGRFSFSAEEEESAMRNIILVGFMGTGKTTVGKLIAEKTGMPLVDMDSLIVERAGKSINDIFAQEGEAYFRQLERELVQELAATSGNIISTGGGIVLNPDNIADFEKNGLVVCLLADAESVLDRVRHDTARPLLAGDKEKNIIHLLETRRPLYESITHKINTSGRPSPIPTAQEIIDLYESINS